MASFRFLTTIDLGEDFIHDTGGEDDFAVRDRQWAAKSDAVVKALNKLLHSRILVKPLPNKIGDVDTRVLEMLVGSPKRWYEISEITLTGSIFISNNASAAVIDGDRTFWTVEAQLVEPF